MALSDITENTKELKGQVEKIVKDSIAYYKLFGFKIAAKSATELVKFFVVSSACFLIVLLLSLAGGFALAEYWDNDAYGFLTMAGVLFLLLMLFLAAKSYIIDKPILRILSKFLNDN